MGPPREPYDLPDALIANREELRRRSRAERVRPLWLWTGVLTGPVAFLIVHVAGGILVTHGCGHASGNFLGLTDGQLAVLAISLACAVVTTAAGLKSWSIWRLTSLRQDEVSVEGMPRVPFWALGGTILSAFFLFAIALT